MKKTDRVMTVESGRHRAYRIYITDGISPAITTPSGGGLIPKIIEYEERRTEDRELLSRQERED